MAKGDALQNTNLGKHYIFTGAIKPSDLDLDDINDALDYNWREVSRRLQARRWRKFDDQLI